MAKSLAFWVEGSNPVENNKPEVELHFNYWSLSGSSETVIDYLDVGVKFSGLKNFDAIKVFFPFHVTEHNYAANLGRAVCNTPTLISAIFNTRVKETRLDGERMDITFRHEKESKLRFHCQIEVGPHSEGVTLNRLNREGDGTTLSFPIMLFKKEKETVLEDIPHYFRFRIKMSAEDKKVISQLSKQKDSKLLSRFDSTEIVDFRVNEIRNLPAQIRSKLEYESYISSVHFFLIRETNSEHKLSHTEFKRCRVLEKDLWETYLKENDEEINLPEQMLIYHWREQSKRDSSSGALIEYLENFSAFAKFSKTIVTGMTIVWFVISVILLGAISGISGNYIYSYLTSNDQSVACANTNSIVDELKKPDLTNTK
ncbi:hypothetical protein LOY64_01480 [Pseudomonas corrugata]|uniref:hypothetical protein n=1 Tax=Pseudomonas corrugata TaxID=47879 RepID=UPI00222E45FB|nr:hypothetical protein [Pseudomonas corrugata]UZD95713.1 hypothetical protein LOY64_01480 [Pseudomonas corrugata]